MAKYDSRPDSFFFPSDDWDERDEELWQEFIRGYTPGGHVGDDPFYQHRRVIDCTHKW